MELGDIITREGEEDHRWLVRKIEESTRTAILVTYLEFESKIVSSMCPADADVKEPATHKVICNPIKSWPFVNVVFPRRLGQLTTITAPAGERLLPLFDWIKLDDLQKDGAIYFNPALGLRYPDILCSNHAKGGTFKITVPRNFTTIAKKIEEFVEEYAPKLELPKTVYDRLLDDDYED